MIIAIVLANMALMITLVIMIYDEYTDYNGNINSNNLNYIIVVMRS